MKTIFDSKGQLNLDIFESRLLNQTNNLTELLAAARRTQSSKIESTHFLIALTRISEGFTQKFFRQKGLAPSDLEAGLDGCAKREPGMSPPIKLSQETLDESGRNVIAILDSYLQQKEIFQITEEYLLWATLENLTPAVAENLSSVQLSPQKLIAEIRAKLEDIQDYELPNPFDNQSVRLETFSPGARRVLELMKAETEALGYDQMDPRHLLLALLEYEGGATQIALYQQDVSPKKVQERLMINLRGRAKKIRSQLDLSREFFNSSVVKIIEQAAEETRSDLSGLIAEVHLLRAFLKFETFALRQLADAEVDLLLAKESAQQFKPEDEVAPTTVSEMKSWEAIKSDLEAALVGQQDAMNMCLPFIRRMLFDFRRPGKPVGVFLFCGPSGVGKTETAKAIARAVFGSEENLIMLEMGQFQTRESMNIFVGAPPGYIGYGEGKLTNGLRDKPRSVVLFDEVEKAHPQVYDALLRFIDEGKIDDPAGPIRDGSECIIIMTSNVRTEGLEELIKGDSYKKNKWAIKRKLKEALLNLSVERKSESSGREPFRFLPEFLNRIDEIILFRALDENDLTEIARRHLIEYQDRLKDEKQINLTFAPKLEAVARLIGRFCATLDEGARATFRVAQTAIVDPVIDFVSEKECSFPASLVIHFPQNPESAEEPYGVVDFL